MSRDTARQGIRLALGAAFLFGISTPLAKGLITAMRPQLLAGLLYLGSGIGLGLFCWWAVSGPRGRKRR